MIKIKRENTPYILTAVIMGLDIAIVFLMSLLTIGFDWAALKNSEFWANYCVTLAVTLLAFFGTIGAGKKKAVAYEEYTAAIATLEQKREFVSSNFLDDRLDNYIDCKNRVEKLKSLLTNVDYRLSTVKKEDKRDALKSKKAAIVASLKIATAKIDNVYNANFDDVERTRCEKIVEGSDFNVDSERRVKYRKTDKRVISVGLSATQSGKVGYYSEGESLLKHSATKIMLSVVCTVLMTLLAPGESDTITKGVIFLMLSRLLMIAVNAYSGYAEGTKLISDCKLGAIKEQISVHTQFINYCLGFGIIKKIEKKKEQSDGEIITN